jgi:hypothetical protein
MLYSEEDLKDLCEELGFSYDIRSVSNGKNGPIGLEIIVLKAKDIITISRYTNMDFLLAYIGAFLHDLLIQNKIKMKMKATGGSEFKKTKNKTLKTIN